MALKDSNKDLSRFRGSNVRRKVPLYRRRWFAILTIFTLITGVTAMAIVLSVIKPLRELAESLPMDNMSKIATASRIFDRKGEEIGRIYDLNRLPIKIEQVPQHVIQALTAEEDSRFFQHAGVDFIGIARAVWLNFKAGGENQGASTLTQQLARDVFQLKDLEATSDKNSRYKRKIIEAYAANRIERSFSKAQILEHYLNRVYFGSGCYGIQSAAKGFFGKEVKDLTIEEAASLACVLKNPSAMSPRAHPKDHLRWRNHVLDRMHEERFITASDRDELKSKPIVLAQKVPDPRLTYVYEEVRQQAEKIIGEEASQIGGFNIYTSIDRQLQEAAKDAVLKRLSVVESQKGYPHQTFAQYRTQLDDYKTKVNAKIISADTPRPQPEYLQASALVIDNRDGGILALVGGRDFMDSMFNRALQMRRPVGTAFVPFVYAAAFRSPEFFPAYQIEDGPLDNKRVMIGGTTGKLGEWGTEQPETPYGASITAREALLQGRNAATVRLAEKITLGPLKDLAEQAGIKSPLRDYPSSYLGVSEAKLDEMCLAYTIFPNGGKRPKEVNLIKRITDSAGKVIYQIKDDEDELVPVIDEVAAYQTHSCLSDALTRGTGHLAYSEYGLDKFPAAGKTGTQYGFTDLWFLGYTSAITCGVWCGFDQQKTIYEGAVSNRIALPIWSDIVGATAKLYKPQPFTQPQDMQVVEVCKKSGMRATDACYEKLPDALHAGTKSVRDTYQEILRPRSVFDNYCTMHSGTNIPQELLVKPSIDETPLLAVTANGINGITAEPVLVLSPTIIGEDPYNAFARAPRKAIPVNDDGTTVKRAVPIEEETPASPSLKIAPPPPLKIE
jgi:penicillin-binding protein 1A